MITQLASDAPIQLTRPEEKMTARPHTPNEPETSTRTLIYDGQAAEWSWKQAQVLLTRSTYIGTLTNFAFWLTFLAFSLLIDFVKLEGIYILKQEVYVIKQAYDLGTLSNLETGNYGWTAATIFFLLLLLIYQEGLSDSRPITAYAALTSLNVLYISVIIMCKIGTNTRTDKTDNYLYHVNRLTIINILLLWGLWLLSATYIMVRKMRQAAQANASHQRSLGRATSAKSVSIKQSQR